MTAEQFPAVKPNDLEEFFEISRTIVHGCGYDHDMLDASHGHAHCRQCGTAIPATDYDCVYSGRCCSLICQALRLGLYIPLKPSGEIDSAPLRRTVKSVFDDPPIIVKERIFPAWFTEAKERLAAEQAKQQERAKLAEERAAIRSHKVMLQGLRDRATELDIRWPRNWKTAGWRTERQFIKEMGKRIASKEADLAAQILPVDALAA